MRQCARKSRNNCKAITCFDCTICISALPSSSACNGNSLCIKTSRASRSCSLLLIDSSILMRSIPSEYSPNRGNGITTSSLILKALVCLAMAAVRARSNQNFLRASADTATNPSPLRALHKRTMCDAASPTAFSSSEAMSAINTILGRC